MHLRSVLLGIAVVVTMLCQPNATHAAEAFPNCKATTATYSGNLASIANADATCNGAFPGYRFARNDRIVQNSWDAAHVNKIGWVATTVLCYAHPNYYNCNNWTSSAATPYRGATGSSAGNRFPGTDCTTDTYNSYNYGTSPHLSQYGYTEACSAALPLWCCNF